MSLFGGMKEKLGFNERPEWQDEDDYADQDDSYGYQDEENYDEYGDEGYSEDEQGGSGQVLSFDAYNPSNFEHVTPVSDKAPQVASYDSLDTASSTRYGSRYGSRAGSSSRAGSRRSGSASRSYSRSSSSTDDGQPTWDAPDDPSFLDDDEHASSHEIFEEISSQAKDSYTGLGSDFLSSARDPKRHIAIIKPEEYADVEKVANAAKAGKTAVLCVEGTKPALAKRILDFSFGVASALNMNVDKAAERTFVIFKGNEMLSDSERDYLKEQGVLS